MVKLLKDYALYIDETEAEFSLVRILSDTRNTINTIVVKCFDNAEVAFDKIETYLKDMITEGGFNDTELSQDEIEECFETLELLKLRWM